MARKVLCSKQRHLKVYKLNHAREKELKSRKPRTTSSLPFAN